MSNYNISKSSEIRINTSRKMFGHSRNKVYGQGGHGWEHPTLDFIHMVAA